MRKLFGWIAGLVGIAALARVLARRHAPRQAPALPPPTSDPADELRRKLSATREEAPVVPEPAPSPAEPSETLDQRRSRVHAKAQEAIDAMQDPPE